MSSLICRRVEFSFLLPETSRDVLSSHGLYICVVCPLYSKFCLYFPCCCAQLVINCCGAHKVCSYCDISIGGCAYIFIYIYCLCHACAYARHRHHSLCCIIAWLCVYEYICSRHSSYDKCSSIATPYALCSPYMYSACIVISESNWIDSLASTALLCYIISPLISCAHMH